MHLAALSRGRYLEPCESSKVPSTFRANGAVASIGLSILERYVRRAIPAPQVEPFDGVFDFPPIQAPGSKLIPLVM